MADHDLTVFQRLRQAGIEDRGIQLDRDEVAELFRRGLSSTALLEAASDDDRNRLAPSDREVEDE